MYPIKSSCTRKKRTAPIFSGVSFVSTGDVVSFVSTGKFLDIDGFFLFLGFWFGEIRVSINQQQIFRDL